MGNVLSFSFDINNAWFELRGTTSGVLKTVSNEPRRGPDLDWKLHGDMPRQSSEASDVARDPILIGLERRTILPPARGYPYDPSFEKKRRDHQSPGRVKMGGASEWRF
jgi:hypothetical protein